MEEIGSGPLPYEFGTDLVVDDNDVSHVVYHDGNDRINQDSNLIYAVRTAGGWVREVVDSAGDVGKFASLRLDSQERPHIAYLDWTETRGGFVKYAFWNGEAWEIEQVDELLDIEISFLGARRMMTIALDDQDRPHIAYSDRQILTYARKTSSGWEKQFVAVPTADNRVLGQLASLGLDDETRPHITFFELPSPPSSSLGTIYYAVGEAPRITAVEEGAEPVVPEVYQLSQNYPNPFNPSTVIRFRLPLAAAVELTVYNLAGQRIRTLVEGVRSAGVHQVTWDGRDGAGRVVASGVYFSRLHAADFVGVRKMVLLY